MKRGAKQTKETRRAGRSADRQPTHTGASDVPARGVKGAPIPEHIYSRHALTSLRIGLKQVANRNRRDPRVGDRLLANLGGPLVALEHLFQGAKAMFEGRENGEARFRKTVIGMIERAPGNLQGVARLRARAGLPPGLSTGAGSGAPRGARAMAGRSHGFIPREDPVRMGCSIVRPDGMTTLILGVARLGLGDLTQPALNAIADLSIAEGHLEHLNYGLVHDGIDGLEGRIRDASMRGDPGYDGLKEPSDGPGGAPGGGVSLTDPGGGSPEPGQPGDPFGPDDPLGDPDLWGRREPPVPLADTCELLREACEAMLMEAVNSGLPAMPRPPGLFTWADNIESVELLGECAGDTIIIHGHGFGNSQPQNVKLVMHVGNGCSVVPPTVWTDTRIEAILPNGITCGAVGFYDEVAHQGAIETYNGQATMFNRAAREMMIASKCLGAPLLLDTFRHIPMREVQCAPDLGLNYIEAGLPIIRGFSAATEFQSGALIVADPDDDIVLRWNVQNADQVRLSRFGTAGPAVPGSPRDVTGETSFDLGTPGHTTFETFTYRLVATNVCGSVVSEVIIIGSKRPGLAINRIEVTQSIQRLDNSLRLVAQKPAVVRAYLTHALDGFDDDTVPNVSGTMSIYSRGVYKGSFYPVNGVAANPPDPPAPDRDASITVLAVDDPPPPATATNDTLNFVIPASLAEDELEIHVDATVNNFGSPSPGAPGFSQTATGAFEGFRFIERKPLMLRFIPAKVTADAAGNPTITMAGTSNPPTEDECRTFLIETMGPLPVTADSIERLEGFSVTLDLNRIVLETPWFTWEINSGWSESLVYDIEANAFTYFLGLLRLCELGTSFGVCTEDHDAIWAVIVPVTGVWGRANGIPGREYITPFSTISSSHELSHCLNQKHLANSGCSGNNPTTGGSAITDAANWEDSGQIVEDKAVPFNVIRNRTVTDSDDGVFDLMTYCPTRWVTTRRWNRIFDYVGNP